MHVVLACTRETAAKARMTVRHVDALAGAACTVLDIDGGYRPTASETVVSPHDLGLPPQDLHITVASLGARAAASALLARLAARVQRHAPTLAVVPGALLLRLPEIPHGSLLAFAHADGLPVPGVPALTPALVGLRGVPTWVTDGWEQHARSERPEHGARWVDHASALLPKRVVMPRAALISATSLRPDDVVTVGHGAATLLLDETPVVALDLSELDPSRPWSLGPSGPARLSSHPELARLVGDLASELARDEDEDPPPGWTDLTRTSTGTPVIGPVRHLLRQALAAGETPPDPFDPDGQAALRGWLTAHDANGLARYLGAVRATRPDLQRTFPAVPGADATRLHAWALRHGGDEGYDAELLATAAAPHKAGGRLTGRPVPGVTVAGFLSSGIGLGESARLLVAALDAVGVQHSDYAVRGYVDSTDGRPTRAPVRPLDTTVLCVNADLAPAVSAELPPDIARAYRIGMWYWEVEDFPASQHGGFHAVDEVWVATRFVHDAIAPHSPVPVRTLMPPLPQRGPEPTVTPADLGLGDRPYLLFTFDFLSTAERKNPWGLVDAYRAAFAPGEGPGLVIKSINADRRPADAERLRLAVAGHPDIVLVERYLPASERDGLVAHCLAYVSLHRSEGLGLTIAEAMAWGKPVIATAYSGNLEFMTEDNSFLVPWTPVPIPDDAAPYPPGSVWAEPDLAVAADLMRRLVTDPDEAATRGARAARDIAVRHNPAVAGAAFAARLAELGPARRAKARRDLVRRLRRTAAAARDAWR